MTIYIVFSIPIVLYRITKLLTIQLTSDDDTTTHWIHIKIIHNCYILSPLHIYIYMCVDSK
jgi:hypothetical protein